MREKRVCASVVVTAVLMMAALSGWWVAGPTAVAATEYTHTLTLSSGESVFVECGQNALRMSRLSEPALAVALFCYDDSPDDIPSKWFDWGNSQVAWSFSEER